MGIKVAKLWTKPLILGYNNILLHQANKGTPKDLSATVSLLIDINTQWWDVEKIRALFNPKVTKNILRVPIGPNHYTNKWS